MKQPIQALLVYDQAEHLDALKGHLEAQSVLVWQVPTLKQAVEFLQSPAPPPLVFTDMALSDGTWADVLAHAARALATVNVIVVSRWVDAKAHISAIECGAFDFLVPPFDSYEVAHVVRCALTNVNGRRAAR